MNLKLERTSHPSAAQVDALVKFIEGSPLLAKGVSKCASQRIKALKEWSFMSKRLNSIGGTVKTPQKWMKYWSDKKSAVKRKMRARAAAAVRNDGDSNLAPEPPELTEAEQRMAVLMGCAEDIAEDKDIIVHPYEEHNDQEATNNPPATIPEFVDTETTCYTSTSSQSSKQLYVLYAEPVPAASPAHGTAVTPGTQTARPVHRPSVEEHSSTHSSINQTRSYTPTATKRQRQLRYAVNSSLSQNHMDFLLPNIAEKFLRLEERRLAIEERTAALLERNAERDRVMAEGIKAMGEGLKALAEALNRR